MSAKLYRPNLSAVDYSLLSAVDKSKEISNFAAEVLVCKTEMKINNCKYMKIMYGNCGLRNEYERDLRSSENKARKAQVIRDLKP